MKDEKEEQKEGHWEQKPWLNESTTRCSGSNLNGMGTSLPITNRLDLEGLGYVINPCTGVSVRYTYYSTHTIWRIRVWSINEDPR